MSINFPPNPITGDVYALGNRSWQWNGFAWDTYAFAPGAVYNFEVSGDLNVAQDINTQGNLFSSQDINISGVLSSSGDINILGDIILSDESSFTTTLQVVTPTANRVISFPNATGTVALIAGGGGQVVVSRGGLYEAINGATFNENGEFVLSSSRINISTNGSLFDTQSSSGPTLRLTGTWIGAGGTATTTKPQLLVEPTTATSTGWSTLGTGLGINAASGFTGRLIDLQTNGTSRFSVSGTGVVLGTQPTPVVVNATATITVADIQTGIITSNSGGPTAVNMTLPTGTLMDGGFTGLYNDLAIEWSIVNLGTGNNVNLFVNTGHTVVGNPTISSNTSARFISRRTATTTWVSYRLS
jgi:hypothetical protein